MKVKVRLFASLREEVGVKETEIELDDGTGLLQPDEVRARLTLVNKIDYLELSDFDMEAMRERVLRLNPGIQIFQISAKTGEGVEEWAAWLSREATGFIRG